MTRRPATLFVLSLLLFAIPAFAWNWDKDGNRIDDRIERVEALGIAAAYEHNDPTNGRLIIPFAQEGGVLRFPVYVGFEKHPTEADLGALRATGVSTAVFRPYVMIPYVRMALTSEEIRRVAAVPGVNRIESVEMVYPLNNIATKSTGAAYSDYRRFPTIHRELGFTGRGIVVSILDTGVNDQTDPAMNWPGHEAFPGKFVAGGIFYSGQPELNTTHDQSENPLDRGPRTQHGTHVAGTTLGTGGPSGIFGGVAPDAMLVDQKVLSDAGAGFGSADGVEWAIVNKDKYGIRVLNLSLGTLTESDGTDASSRMINAAFDAGLVPVVAAGNDSKTNYMPSPAAADKAITIGSLDDFNTIDRRDERVASYSNEGPRKSDGDADFVDEMKPVVSAPGSGIVSADGFLATDGRQYKPLSGTSMATPNVAGVVALMLQANPALTPTDVLEILKHTADHRNDWGKTPASSNPFPQGDPNYHPSGGWGEVDGYAAVKEALRLAGDPASQTQVIRIEGKQASDGSAAVDLSWVSQREINLVGYDVYRAEDAGGRPGTFVRVTGSTIPGVGSAVIERARNRNVYTIRDGGLQFDTTYWYRVTHTSSNPAIGTIHEPAYRITLGRPKTVARIQYSITHNAIDNDLLVLVGTGPQVERARWVIDGKASNEADQVIVEPGEATAGNRRHEFTINLTNFDGVEKFLPPSEKNPWFLSVKEGGFVNRAGRVNSFSITLLDDSGNPVATYSTADPTPQPTVENTTLRLWIPDNPDVTLPGETPSIIEVDPAAASQGAENVRFEVFGSEFLPGASLEFSGSGISVRDLRRDSGSRLIATLSVAPTASAGARDVTVRNPDGGSGTLQGGFTVVGDGNGGGCTAVSSTLEDGDPAIGYGNGWHTVEDANASGGTYHRRIRAGNSPQSSARLVFTGSQVTYHFARSLKGGSAEIWIDGALIDTVSFAGGTQKPEFGHSRTYQVGEGTHELEIRAISDWVYLDRLEVAGCDEVAANQSAVQSRDVTESSSLSFSAIAPAASRSVVVGEKDLSLTVLVEEASSPVAVSVVSAGGVVVATGGALSGSVSGLESVLAPGTYTVQVVSSGANDKATLTVARTVGVN